MSSTYYRFSKQ